MQMLQSSIVSAMLVNVMIVQKGLQKFNQGCEKPAQTYLICSPNA